MFDWTSLEYSRPRCFKNHHGIRYGAGRIVIFSSTWIILCIYLIFIFMSLFNWIIWIIVSQHQQFMMQRSTVILNLLPKFHVPHPTIMVSGVSFLVISFCFFHSSLFIPFYHPVIIFFFVWHAFFFLHGSSCFFVLFPVKRGSTRASPSAYT